MPGNCPPSMCKSVGEERYGQFVVCNICQSIKERKVSSPKRGETFEISSDKDEENCFKPIEIPEELWEMFPQNGTYIVEIMKFAGYIDTKGILDLRKKEKREKMFHFVADMIEQVPDRKKMFGLFENIPEKVTILPGLECTFFSFLDECENLSRKKIDFLDPKMESERRKRKASVQPSTPMNKKSTETIEMVESRLNKWMEKNEHNGSFSITEADGVKFFHCLNCQKKLKLNKHTEGKSILSNIHRHFKQKECIRQTKKAQLKIT